MHFRALVLIARHDRGRKGGEIAGRTLCFFDPEGRGKGTDGRKREFLLAFLFDSRKKRKERALPSLRDLLGKSEKLKKKGERSGFRFSLASFSTEKKKRKDARANYYRVCAEEKKRERSEKKKEKDPTSPMLLLTSLRRKRGTSFLDREERN